MQYTTLGKTGLKVSRLGFGCMRLPMKEGSVDRDQTTPMLRRAVDLGINFFDTAVGYCNSDSQRALGEAMVGLRDKVILSTKNGHYNKRDEKGWWKNLADSLERMRIDCLDLYNFHGLSWARWTSDIAGPDGQLQWMLRAKGQGMIRHLGFSFHDTAENLKKLASSGCFENVILQYNLLDRSLEPAFEHVAVKCGMGITVMGPVGGGRLGADSDEIRRMLPGARSVPEVALRFVLSNPHVCIALSGMNAMAQLEENVKVAGKRTPLASAEKRRVTSVLRRFKKLADLYCTGCNYCMPCPSGVNIPGNFSALNYWRVYGLQPYAKNVYNRLGGAQASYCLACGKCLSKCPQKIDVIHQLQETVRTLDDAYGSLVGQVIPTGLESFSAAKGRWQAALSGRLLLHNLSDEPVEAKVSFTPSERASTEPHSAASHIEGFKRWNLRLKLTCRSDGADDFIDLGAKVEGGQRVLLGGGAFRLAFAAPAGKSGAKAARRAIPVQVSGKEHLVRGKPRAATRHGIEWRFAYDDEALYFLARVKDDLRQPAASGRSAQATDRISLMIDARPPLRFGRPSFEPEVFHLNFLAPGAEGVPLIQVARPRGADATALSCESARLADGYQVAARIPWIFLNLKPSSRAHLGIDVSLVSHDRTGATDVEMAWSSMKSVGRPDHYGHLFLIGDR